MELLKADTIERYCHFYQLEVRHPLVNIVRFDRAERLADYRIAYGFYALFLKKTQGCVIDYGKTRYDFDAGTVVGFGPGQTVGIHRTEGPAPEAVGLLFHPDFLHRTPLGQQIKRYSFFGYASTEALHLSAEEQRTIEDYMEKIDNELRHPIDKFTKSLVVSNIEVLLNYCMRFYERQFITREELNHDVLVRFEQLLDEYLYTGRATEEGVPKVKYFADRICLSPNYFGDLIKSETGRTAQEYIHLKMIEAAKSGMSDPAKSVQQIADALGFRYPQHFVRFFKREVGVTPREYRLTH